MLDVRYKLWNNRVLGQLSKFCLVGLGNTAVDFTIYISLTRGWEFWLYYYLGANLIAFVVANIFSFVVNKSWTFKNKEYSSYHWQYLKFLIVSLGALVIVEITLFVFVDWLGIYDLVGKVVGIVLSLLWSFAIHRRWTFR